MLKQKGTWIMMNEYVKSHCAKPYYPLQACLQALMLNTILYEKSLNFWKAHKSPV